MEISFAYSDCQLWHILPQYLLAEFSNCCQLQLQMEMTTNYEYVSTHELFLGTVADVLTRIFALKLTKQSWAESNLAACHTHTHTRTWTCANRQHLKLVSQRKRKRGSGVVGGGVTWTLLWKMTIIKFNVHIDDAYACPMCVCVCVCM